MEPAFARGDLLFLTNDRTDPVRVGEVVVFKVAGRDIPIVSAAGADVVVRALTISATAGPPRHQGARGAGHTRHHLSHKGVRAPHAPGSAHCRHRYPGRDANRVDDRSLYARGQVSLTPDDVVGRAQLFVPHIGIVTILMNDYPEFKFGLLGLLGLFVLLHREE